MVNSMAADLVNYFKQDFNPVKLMTNLKVIELATFQVICFAEWVKDLISYFKLGFKAISWVITLEAIESVIFQVIYFTE